MKKADICCIMWNNVGYQKLEVIPEYLTVGPVAKQLGLSEYRVRELIREKQICATQIGQWRVKPEDLNLFDQEKIFKKEDVDLVVLAELTYFPDYMPLEALGRVKNIPLIVFVSQTEQWFVELAHLLVLALPYSVAAFFAHDLAFSCV